MPDPNPPQPQPSQPPQDQPAQASQPSETVTTAQLEARAATLERREKILDSGRQKLRAEAEALAQQRLAFQQELAALRQATNEMYGTVLRLHNVEAAPILDVFDREIGQLRGGCQEHDLIFSAEIRFTTKDKEHFRFHVNHVLPSFCDAVMLAESRRNFEALIYAQVVRPCLSQIQKLLNTYVTNTNPLPEGPTFAPPDVRNLPASGPAAPLSTT